MKEKQASSCSSHRAAACAIVSAGTYPISELNSGSDKPGEVRKDGGKFELWPVDCQQTVCTGQADWSGHYQTKGLHRHLDRLGKR